MAQGVGSGDLFGQYGAKSHNRRGKGGKKGVVIKMNWTYELENGKIGTVKYMGPVQHAKGDWVGLELANGFKGKHNGTVEGVQYFNCVKGQGILVKASKLKKRVNILNIYVF